MGGACWSVCGASLNCDVASPAGDGILSSGRAIVVGTNSESVSVSSWSSASCWLLQLPSRLGRQFEHWFPAFTQAHFLHLLCLLHLQHTMIQFRSKNHLIKFSMQSRKIRGPTDICTEIKVMVATENNKHNQMYENWHLFSERGVYELIGCPNY